MGLSWRACIFVFLFCAHNWAMVFRGLHIYMPDAHCGIQVSFLWFCWALLVGLEELPGSTWSCVCLFFLDMLLIERKFTYWCGCSSFANAAADNDRSSAGALPLLVHTAAGTVLRTDWGNGAEQASIARHESHGNAVSSAAVCVKRMWMGDWVSLHQHGATALVITGQWWAPTSEQKHK